jgi:hypothetical protein
MAKKISIIAVSKSMGILGIGTALTVLTFKYFNT